MTTCTITGNSDMYGLGIRIGFYLQWFGTILASWPDRTHDEVPALRFSNSLFVSATFIALLIQTAKNNLRPVEIYIILLLTFGRYFHFVPIYIWRLLVCCDPRLDPTRHPRVHAGPVFSGLNFLLLASVSIYHLWFWYHLNGLALGEKEGCVEYGFFFGRVLLDGKGFMVANILLHFGLLISCVVILLLRLRKRLRRSLYEESETETRSSETDRNKISSASRLALQQLYTAMGLSVATVVVMATELTISWNGIEGVGQISSAGQTIPMIIGIGHVARILYIWIFGDIDAKYRDRHDKRATASSTDFVLEGSPID